MEANVAFLAHMLRVYMWEGKETNTVRGAEGWVFDLCEQHVSSMTKGQSSKRDDRRRTSNLLTHLSFLHFWVRKIIAVAKDLEKEGAKGLQVQESIAMFGVYFYTHFYVFI